MHHHILSVPRKRTVADLQRPLNKVMLFGLFRTLRLLWFQSGALYKSSIVPTARDLSIE